MGNIADKKLGFFQDLPTLILNTFALQRLEKEYLMVRILDHDNGKSSDNVLGKKPETNMSRSYNELIFEVFSFFFCVLNCFLFG